MRARLDSVSQAEGKVMLQSFRSSEQTFWTTALVDPIVNGSETWSGRARNLRAQERQAPSVNDVAYLYPEAVVASSDALAWQDLRLIHLGHSLNEMVVPASDSHCLILNLGSALELHARHSKRSFEGRVLAGEVAIIPAGASWSCQPDSSHLGNILLLFLRPLFVRSVIEGIDFSFGELVLTPQIGFQSKHIRYIAMSLLGELNEANVVGRLYADSLAIGLAMQLIRRYSSLRDVQIGHGGLAPHRLRKAIGLINHHLIGEEEGRVALRSVAKDVGMSYFHFSRAFKQSMGMSPTNYIAERRIERAKKLIRETDLPIAEIALRSGFSSQSHFTTSFRRVAGVTPRCFRKGM
jgi:AraC family transcriptional regulator